jgi:hypothetical protein
MRSNTATDKRAGTRKSILRCVATKSGERHPSATLEDTLQTVDGDVTVKRRGLEWLVREEIIRAFLWGGDALLPKDEGVDVAALIDQQNALSSEKTDVMNYRRDGLLTPAEERARLADIGRESDALRERIEAARARYSEAHMLVDLRDGLHYDGNRISINVAADLSAKLGERFDSLHIEQRRMLVAQLLEIEVSGGRGHDKYRITHRVVKSLNNPDESEEYTDRTKN